jgi:membrane protein
MSLKDFWDILATTFRSWNEDKAPTLGAALAYYTVFSIAPLLLLVIAVASLCLEERAVRGQISAELEKTVGPQVAEPIEQLIKEQGRPEQGIRATLISIVMLLVGASGTFAQLQDALNTIWKVAPKPGRGWKDVIRDRFLPFTMVFGTGFLLLVSLVVSAALSALSQFLASESVLANARWWAAINWVVSFGFITLLFALIYKILPDVKIAWRDVWLGAALTALLFTAGKYLLGLYLARSSVASGYGAAGSLVVILIWVYYSAQIFLFGAELTRVCANRFGRGFEPTDNAICLSDQQRNQQAIPRAETVQAAGGKAASHV